MEGVLQPYLVAFARLVIGLVFAISFSSKVIDPLMFARTIERFGILPARSSTGAALIFLVCEFGVVLSTIAGGTLLIPGFALATGLLLVFCLALASVLGRKVSTSCNCLGPTGHPVSPYDLWRNVGFVFCALGGYGGLVGANSGDGSLSRGEWVVTSLIAAVFVVIWTQLGELMRFFQQG